MIFIKKKIIRYTVFFIILFSLFSWNWYRSYNSIIRVHYYDTNKSIINSTKIIILGDLHDKEFNENNEELVAFIREQHPASILMIGDMINKDSDTIEVVTLLNNSLKDIAPVYYALGNHELEWMDSHDEDLIGQLETAGAIVLNREYCDIEIEGQKIRIGGLYDYAFSLQNLDLTDTTNEKVQVYNFLKEFEDTDAYKIMLSHRPDSFIFGDASKAWDIDLVASGHLHGGQVVLPFLGGVYGGDQGWFPEYVHGLYEKDDMNILVTSGLSTNKKLVPRWNNPPEIVVLELLPANE